MSPDKHVVAVVALQKSQRLQEAARRRWMQALEQRRQAVIKAREAGMTWDEIAGHLGITRAGAIAIL